MDSLGYGMDRLGHRGRSSAMPLSPPPPLCMGMLKKGTGDIEEEEMR